MSHRDFEDDDASLTEDEDPDETEIDDSNQPELVQCPYCHKSINEDAERCHHCGSYTSLEDASRRIPLWMTVGLLLLGLVLLIWVVA